MLLHRPPHLAPCPLLEKQVGFDVSARVLVFWTVMFVAGVFGLTLFMLVALPAKTITVAAAIQVGSAGPGPSPLERATFVLLSVAAHSCSTWPRVLTMHAAGQGCSALVYRRSAFTTWALASCPHRRAAEPEHPHLHHRQRLHRYL